MCNIASLFDMTRKQAVCKYICSFMHVRSHLPLGFELLAAIFSFVVF